MGVFEDVKKIIDLELRGDAEQIDGERRVEWGKAAVALSHKMRAEVDAETKSPREAAALIDAFLEGSTNIAPRPVAEAAPHGLRADGQPKAKPGRKPRAPTSEERLRPIMTTEEAARKPWGTKTPLPSALTDDKRAALNKALDRGPTTLKAIEAETGFENVEALLCEDPDAFVSWRGQRPGDSETVQLRGTFDQFLGAVGMITMYSGDRIGFTAGVLKCTIYAARRAWARLDP